MVVHDLPSSHVHNATTQMLLQMVPRTFQADGIKDDDLPVQIVHRKAAVRHKSGAAVYHKSGAAVYHESGAAMCHEGGAAKLSQ